MMDQGSRIVPTARTIHWTAAFCMSLIVTTHAVAGDVVHYQGGQAHDALVDDAYLIIETDGSQDRLDLALELAADGLATALTPLGDSHSAFVVEVVGTSEAHQDLLASRPGVRAVYPVIRFRQDGHALGVTGTLAVKFNPQVTLAQRLAFELEYDLQLQEQATEELNLRDVYLYTAAGGDSLNRVAALHGDPRLADWKAHADLVPPRLLKQVSPGDELFDRQWHLENTGQFGQSNTLADIDALNAWEFTLGSGVRIGMHDDGCDVTHEDLEPNYFGFGQSGGGGPLNVGPHGTAVMGLMVADDNSFGVRGVAPDARFTATSFGGGFSSDAMAYSFAANLGVEAHNNSWGYIFGLRPGVVVEAIRAAANNGRGGRGMVIVFAAGNSGLELDPEDDLSTLPEVLQVGATSYRDTIASYSNFGRTQDIMGPTLGDDGIGLVTTDITGGGGLNNGSTFNDLVGHPNYTRRMSGTSGASPVVCGVAALMLAENPALNRSQVREILIHTADKVSPQDAQYNGASGFSLKYGYGRVNAANAVEAAATSETWPSVPEDIEVNINEDAEGALQATISWTPTGMPDGDDIDTEEDEVLIVYRVPGETGPTNIELMPRDGQVYEACDPRQFEMCPIPDQLAAPNVVAIFVGDGFEETEENDGTVRRTAAALPIRGNETTDPQQFALYAINRRTNYSFGVVFDQQGDLVIPGPGGGGVLPPPDQGRPIDPELVPVEPGKNEPPSVTAAVDRTVCTAPCALEFHGGAITPNQIVNRGWTFGDGSSSSVNSVVHTYDLPGTYNAVFFAEDDAEPSRIATKLIKITVNAADGDGTPGFGDVQADIKVISPEPFLAPNAQVRFFVDTEGIGGSSASVRVTYRWDFGDGKTGTGQTTENIFANPGFYAVVVEVTEELSSGQQLVVTDTVIVQIQGTAGSSSEDRADPNQSTVGGDATESCGMMGPAMVAFMLVSLVGLRRRWHRAG